MQIVEKAKGVFVGVSMIEGRYQQHKEKLYKIWGTEKHGFPEVILPGVTRNDLYLTIECADFNLDKTIEVFVSIKMANGEFLPVLLSSPLIYILNINLFIFICINLCLNHNNNNNNNN